MRPDLTLWAVPLDAAEPNLIYEHGQILDPRADALRRQEIVAQFSSLSAAAKPVATGGQTEVLAAGGNLMVTVPIEERDEMGRECPVTALLPKHSLRQPGAADDIVDELVEVLGSNRRSVDEADVRTTLAELASHTRPSPRPSSRSAAATLRSLLERAARSGPQALWTLVGALISRLRHLLAPASRREEQEQAQGRESP
jgi:hypothetical protein